MAMKLQVGDRVLQLARARHASNEYFMRVLAWYCHTLVHSSTRQAVLKPSFRTLYTAQEDLLYPSACTSEVQEALHAILYGPLLSVL